MIFRQATEMLKLHSFALAKKKKMMVQNLFLIVKMQRSSEWLYSLSFTLHDVGFLKFGHASMDLEWRLLTSEKMPSN